jgi:hypothetical protein
MKTSPSRTVVGVLACLLVLLALAFTVQPVVAASQCYVPDKIDILGLIVQTVSGQAYATYIEQHIFAPLEMHDSFATEQEARRDGLAQGYRWIFGVPVPFDYYNTAGVPAGYLISSAGDLTHYLIAQMNEGRFGSATVLSSAGIATMHAPAVAGARGGSYGMGWINGPLAGVPATWHDGENFSFHTLLLIEPETRWGAILLVNANNIIPVDGAGNTALESLQNGLARMLSGQPPQASSSLTMVYLILDGVLVVLSALAIFPLLRLRRWFRRFRQRRHRVVRLGLRLTWEVALPVALLLGVSLFASVLGATSRSGNVPGNTVPKPRSRVGQRIALSMGKTVGGDHPKTRWARQHPVWKSLQDRWQNGHRFLAFFLTKEIRKVSPHDYVSQATVSIPWFCGESSPCSHNERRRFPWLLMEVATRNSPSPGRGLPLAVKRHLPYLAGWHPMPG